MPNGYKAQVVSVSKEAAHRYKLAFDKLIPAYLRLLKRRNPHNVPIDRLEKLNTAVVISDVNHNDQPELKQYADGKARKNAIAGFKLKFGKQEKDENTNQVISGDIGIIIVVDMLLTGFDAPIEQVMYLDKVIVNHNLLQAIARVNRVYDDTKKVGFIVDYVGMGNHLKRALDAYWEKEQQEITGCLLDTTDLLSEVKTALSELNSIFEKKGISLYTDPDDIFNLFYDEDIRHDFSEAFQKFSKALDNVFPKKEALDYLTEFNRYVELNTLASQHFRDTRMSMKGISEKLRRVTDEFLVSKGIETKIEPISILDDKFFDNIKAVKRKETKAAKIEHAIREIININIEEDPELYASFAEEVRRILTSFKDNWDEIYRLLEELRKKMKAAHEEDTKGLDRKTQMPIYRKLHALVFDKKEDLTDDEINDLIVWTKEIFGMLKTELSLTGFWKSPANVNRLKGEIQNYLAGFGGKMLVKRNEISSEILAWAKDDRITSAVIYSTEQ